MSFTLKRMFSTFSRGKAGFLFVINFLFVFALIYPKPVSAQASINKIKNTADKYFNSGDYKQALNYYVRYNQYKGGIPKIIKRLAICQLNNNQTDKAHNNLANLIDNNPSLFDAEVYYYFAETLLHQHEFKRAAQAYKQYLQKSRFAKHRSVVIHKLKNCEAGITLKQEVNLDLIENLGPLVNSIEDDIAPIVNQLKDEVTVYYASNFDRNKANPLNAKKSFDIYSTELNADSWTDPALFPEVYSTSSDERPVAFFNSPKIIYFQRGNSDRTKILIDTLSSNDTIDHPGEFSTPDAPIFPELGDRTIHHYGDSVLLFSSQRPSGFGGYDIYYTIKYKTGWRAPVNLGEQINSAYDEKDPFLTNDGAFLYFSSNRSESIGGFDIFISSYNVSTQEWDQALNVGLPVNSAGNERSIQLANATTLLLSSDRKTGYGGYDLYMLQSKTSLLGMGVDRSLKTPGFLALDPVIPPYQNQVTAENEDNSPPTSVPEPLSTIPEKVINIASIYYSADDVVLNPQSLKELDKIARLLNENIKLKLRLLSHSAGYDGPLYLDLYFSVRRAEQVVNYLIEKGVPKNKMTILSVGKQFPYAKKIINGDIAGYSIKLNRRIDILILGGEQYNLAFNYSDAGLNRQSIDERHNQFKTLLSGVNFKIHLLESSQIYEGEILGQIDFPTIEKMAHKKPYLYSVHWLEKYAEAQQSLALIKAKGFSNARIIPYFQGERLDEQGIRTLAGSYPELKKYRDNQR